MKTLLLTLSLIIISPHLFSQSITIGEDGIVRCKDVAIGTTEVIFGETYEVVDRSLLEQRRDEGADLTKSCVSNVTDLSELFKFKVDFNQDIGNWDVSNVTNMSYLFHYAMEFNHNLNEWDVSNVTNMKSTFESAKKFNGNISNWDVSKVIVMSSMFQDATEFNRNISNWNVSSVKKMDWMFYLANSFNEEIGEWDVSSVKNMSQTFRESTFNKNISDWDVSSVTNMFNMFQGSQFNQPIGNWDVSSVDSMIAMFSGSVFNQDIGNWDISNVTDMSNMFSGSVFNQDISNWDVSSVTNMFSMFLGSQFNQPIGNWDVSNVTNMERMFQESKFNQSIGNWNVSSVTNMGSMFAISVFNQPISNWCVYNIFSEPNGFSYESPLTDENKPVWGTCLGKPGLITIKYPTNGAVGIEMNPTFSWEDDSVSTSYQVILLDGNNIIQHDTTTSLVSIAYPSNLEPKTFYFWKIRGLNESKNLNGEWNTIYFETIGYPVDAITLNEPKNNSKTELNTSFIWNYDSNADSYQIELQDYIGFDTVLDTSIIDTSLKIPSKILDFDKLYRWRVRGFNETLGYGEWSEYWNFNTCKENSSSNLISNGNFSQGMENWGTYILRDFATSIYTKECALQVANLPGTGYNIEVRIEAKFDYDNYEEDFPDLGEEFIVSFDAKSTGEDNAISIHLGETRGSWASYFSTHPDDAVKIDSTMTTYTLKSTRNSDIPIGGLFIYFNYGVGDILLDNVIFKKFTSIQLDSPSNESILNVLNPELKWLTKSGFTEYQIEISDDNFDSIFISEETIDSSFTTNNLDYNTVYYWRVRGTNSSEIGDWSEIWTFTTEVEPVDKITLKSPSDNSSDLNTNPTLIWLNDTKSDLFYIEVSADDFETFVHKESTTDTTLNLSKLEYNTTYSWKVRGSNKSGEGEWSDTWRFRTETLSSYDFSSLSPSKGSLINNNLVTLVWEDFTTPPQDRPRVDGYHVQVSTTSEFSDDVETNWNGKVVNEIVTDTSFTSPSLEYDTKHYWRVRAVADEDASNWTEVWNFTTMKSPLLSPPLSTPFNEQVNVGTLTEFTWNEVESSVSYHLQVSSDDQFSSTVFDSSKVGSTSFTLTEPLSENTTYFWRMKSISDNDLRNSEWSDTLTFTTGVRTSIEDELIPQEYILSQNYPNPFNPSTQIQYALPEATQVTLDVFNSLGQKVVELVNGQQSAGYHTVTFDASGLSSGVYLYKLTTPSFSQTNKMLLIK